MKAAAVVLDFSYRYFLGVPHTRFSPQVAIRLGKNIARIRTKAGISQDQMAELVGISTRYIQRIEQGENIPSLTILLTLRKILKTNWDDIYAGL